MMSEVEEIVSKLKEKHGEKYTPVQLNCWANMGQYLIRMNLWTHHKKKSFIGKKRSADAPGVFPGKRITLRSECIDKLDKWHNLKECGVTTEEYDDLQKAILTVFKKF